MMIVVALSMSMWLGGLAMQNSDSAWIESVCDQVRTSDKLLVEHIEHLASIDRNDFLNDLREYVKAIRNFQSCMEQDKDFTVSTAQDILEEEGPKFYYHYDPEYIQNILNYSEMEMDECNDLQKQAVDAWIEIDKHLSTDDKN